MGDGNIKIIELLDISSRISTFRKNNSMGKYKSLELALAEVAQKNERMKNATHYIDFNSNIFGQTMDERFIKMFQNGSGSELMVKGSSVKSSSMLGYNFFHWISKERPIVIDGIEYTDVAFEVKIPVLKIGGPANMDVVLYNIDKGNVLFIESKFLEYVSTEAFKLKPSYHAPKRYYNLERGERWTKFIKEYDTSAPKQYWPGIKQEICHLIGLSNWINDDINISVNGSSINKDGNIRFINLIFQPDKEQFNKEYAKFNSYTELYKEFHNSVENAGLIPTPLKMEFKTYSDIWSNIKSSAQSELIDYLYEHYMQFAAK